jgi:3-deoxy-7-phosphoheptulonate synthase
MTLNADQRLSAVHSLISPVLLREQLPASSEMLAFVQRARSDIAAILEGRDDRLLVVGPCSIHNHDEAIEYAQRLQYEAQALQSQLVVVMRTYFEKPRTTVGWKGYINDPGLDGSCCISEGLRRARELLLSLNRLGLPVGTEFLDMLVPQYIVDLVAWGAIGARTSESQPHRQLASGLSCPVAFKNNTEGNTSAAVDALISARTPHVMLGLTEQGVVGIFETQGNEHVHIVLRGGHSGPNYGATSVDATCASLQRAGLRPQVMIDCSHANSLKQYARQIEVARDIAKRIKDGDRRLIGVMIESYLEEGRQDFLPNWPLLLGISITDACLSWRQTVPLLHAMSEAVHSRRHRPGGALQFTC